MLGTRIYCRLSLKVVLKMSHMLMTSKGDLREFVCSPDITRYKYFVISAAENRAVAVENSLSFFQEEHPDIIQHMRAEAEAREQLASVTKLLQKYQLIYGDSSSVLTPDLQSLSTRLQEREHEIQNLRLLEKQHEQVRFFDDHIEKSTHGP